MLSGLSRIEPRRTARIYHRECVYSPTGCSAGLANRDDRAEFRRYHGELLAQGQVFKGELAVAADEEGEEPEQGE